MRILKFKVEKQKITKDPTCDFSNIAKGTKGYLVADFSFSPDWDKCVKVGVFRALGGNEVAAPIIKGQCVIPSEALIANMFYVSAIGQKEGYRIATEKTEVEQS